MKASGKTIRRAGADRFVDRLDGPGQRRRPVEDTGARWMMAIRDMAQTSRPVSTSRRRRRHRAASRACRPGAGHVPCRASAVAVLLAFGQGLEGDPAIGGRDTVGAVAVARSGRTRSNGIARLRRSACRHRRWSCRVRARSLRSAGVQRDGDLFFAVSGGGHEGLRAVMG